MVKQQTPEGSVKLAIRTMVKHIPGVLYLRVQSGGYRGRMRLNEPGWPDVLLVLRGGRVLWVEVKREKGGVLADVQLAKIDELRRMGHEVIVAETPIDVHAKLKAMRVLG